MLFNKPVGWGIPTIDIQVMPINQVDMINLNKLLSKVIEQKKKKKKMSIEKIYKPLMDEESDKLIDQEKLSAEEIAKKAMTIASNICIYTNSNFTIEKL